MTRVTGSVLLQQSVGLARASRCVCAVVGGGGVRQAGWLGARRSYAMRATVAPGTSVLQQKTRPSRQQPRSAIASAAAAAAPAAAPLSPLHGVRTLSSSAWLHAAASKQDSKDEQSKAKAEMAKV